MNPEVYRVPAVQLSLADAVFDDRAGVERWLRVVALAVDGDDVLVTCQGEAEALRLPSRQYVAARRSGTPEAVAVAEDVDMNEWMSLSYSGDVASATAAVAAHAKDQPVVEPEPMLDDPVAHYEGGLYGGDLEAIIDALGGTSDARTRVLREAATRRHLAEAQGPGSSTPGRSADLDDDDLIDTLSEWYVGDGGFSDISDF